MTNDPHNVKNIPVGTPVVGFNGELLGRVREVHPHYLLIGRAGEHDDLDVPVHAIVGFTDGTLHVSVSRSSVTAVDDQETAHRMGDDPE